MKNVYVQRWFTDEATFSAATDAKNENIVMDIFMDDAEFLVANTDTAITLSKLRSSRLIFQCLFAKLPEQDERCGCDIKMKMGHVFSDPP